MDGVNGLQTLSFIGFEVEEYGLPLSKRLEKVDWFIEAVRSPTLNAALKSNVEDDAATNAMGDGGARGNGGQSEQPVVDVDGAKAVTAAVM